MVKFELLSKNDKFEKFVFVIVNLTASQYLKDFADEKDNINDCDLVLYNDYNYIIIILIII